MTAIHEQLDLSDIRNWPAPRSMQSVKVFVRITDVSWNVARITGLFQSFRMKIDFEVTSLQLDEHHKCVMYFYTINSMLIWSRSSWVEFPLCCRNRARTKNAAAWRQQQRQRERRRDDSRWCYKRSSWRHCNRRRRQLRRVTSQQQIVTTNEWPWQVKHFKAFFEHLVIAFFLKCGTLTISNSSPIWTNFKVISCLFFCLLLKLPIVFI